MRSPEWMWIDLIPAGCLALAGGLLLAAVIRIAGGKKTKEKSG